jgi:hypothetical protein
MAEPKKTDAEAAKKAWHRKVQERMAFVESTANRLHRRAAAAKRA